MKSDKLTWNEFVRIAEQAKGGKFDVTYDSLELYKSGKITELPSHPAVYPFFPKPALQSVMASFGRATIEKMFELESRPETMSLKEQFPEIKARSMKELLSAAEVKL